MANDLTNAKVEEIAKALKGSVGTGRLTRKNLTYALSGMPGLRASTGRELNSRGLEVLDQIMRTPELVGDPSAIGPFLKRVTNSPITSIDNASALIKDVDLLDNTMVSHILRKAGFGNSGAGRVIKSATRMSDDAARGIGKALSSTALKKAVTGTGALLLGGLAKAFSGPVLDVAMGTDANAPGGLSNGELPGIQPDVPAITSAQERRINRREQRRTGSYDRRSNRAIDEDVMNMARELAGEEEVIATADSPTSGSNNILRSLSGLLGK